MSEYTMLNGAKSRAYNTDCVEKMREYPDQYFDLAVVDPPYGGWARQGRSISRTGGGWAENFDKKIIAWDNAPSKEYFDELFRVSKQQVIWGGNYFDLPPCRCFIAWHKTNIPEEFTMSNVEYAWTSFNGNAKVWHGSSLRSKDGTHFHPTEKPQALYAWIYSRFAKPGDKILDTHLGSGTNRRAAWDAGLDFTAFEIDEEYFRKQEEVFAEYVSQISFADARTEENAAEQLMFPAT